MTELPHVGPLRTYPYHDWSKLQGAIVEVLHDGAVVRDGYVDAATADGTMLWLAQEGPWNRMLIDKGSGYEIRVAPDQFQRIRLMEQRFCATGTR
ncbi:MULTISPECIES: hypothetical protein [unclassified Pseudarthrobacter]|uniref:hypothetical protein n=1 Tax=unclassified Pseudarthrobacter TaxID=2647000 RepID=UPI00362C2D53